MNGRVYCVGFSDGLVKIGCTSDVSRRLTAYHAQARPFRVTVSQHWASKEIVGAKEAEVKLLRAVSAIAEITCGREWFRGASLADVVVLAESLVGLGDLSEVDTIVSPAWNEVEFIYLPTGSRARLLDSYPNHDGHLYVEVLSEEGAYTCTAAHHELRLAPQTANGWRAYYG